MSYATTGSSNSVAAMGSSPTGCCRTAAISSTVARSRNSLTGLCLLYL